MFTYPLFNSFPTEIHALILEQCPPNDRTCLRLTCKYLYTLSPPKYPISLTYAPTPEILCCKPGVLHLFPSASPSTGIKHSFPIRECGFGIQTCHDRSLLYINQHRNTQHLPPLTKRKCRDNWSPHCPCFSRSGILYKQLQSWMPKGMKYCSSCSVFTKRRKSTHNLPQHPHRNNNNNSHIKSNLWTSHKGHGGYYRKIWKKWFNNSAWDAMEARMRGERKKNERYDLRRRYRPIVKDTRGMRCEGFV
ncbi:hypothetical protein EAF04_002411 [Stromatinia cepivora]|nr:hypothetical protein EAF04_002411 [Stromatinia cepivora]